jgi:hypothetical protein
MNAKEKGLLAASQSLSCNLGTGISSKEVQTMNCQMLDAKGLSDARKHP